MAPPLKAQLRPRSPRYNPDTIEKIFDKVSEGATLREVCAQPGMPSTTTVNRWIAKDEELFKRWQAVKQLRAHHLFDEQIDLARELAYGVLQRDGRRKREPLTPAEVNARKVAIETFRDAAAKLHPKEYGHRKAPDTIVPIQIITNMNLGQDGKKPNVGSVDAVYEIVVPSQKLLDARDIDESN